MGPSKSGGKEGKDFDAFHLLPAPDGEETKIYHVKLNDAVLEQLKSNKGQARIKLTDGKQSQTSLRIGDRSWTVQWNTQSAGSENAVIDCLVEKDGYYLAVGALAAKATIRDEEGVEMVAKKLQGKNQEAASNKKKAEAGMKIDTVREPSVKKRKANNSTVIGDDEDLAGSRGSDKSKHKQTMDESELAQCKEKIIHLLAIRDMTLKELTEAIGHPAPPGLQKVVKEVADSDQSMGVTLYKIHGKVLRKVDAAAWKDYKEHERELVEARCNLIRKFEVKIESDQDVQEWKEKFETKCKMLEEKEGWLQKNQKKFEDWDRQAKGMEKQMEKGKCTQEEVNHHKAGVVGKYNRSNTEIMKMHAQYLHLFDELSAIKDAIREYQKKKRKQAR